MKSGKRFWAAVLVGLGIWAVVVQTGCAAADRMQNGNQQLTSAADASSNYGSYWAELRSPEGRPLNVYGPPRSQYRQTSP